MSDTFDPPIGVPQQIAPMLRRIVAPNASPMTYRGTNSYLLGETDIAVIDPGPRDETHLRALLGALRPGQVVTHIIVTHSHKDHSPLARDLSKATGAPVLAFGGAKAGRSDVMRRLSQSGLEGGGEGVDHDFAPDMILSDGERIATDDWILDVMHTPGHMGNHICLGWQDSCFSGDHVMGWATSLVSPPDGDLTDFMRSCRRLAKREWRQFFPGHGDIITAPNDRLAWLIKHRKARETAILSFLRGGPRDARAITAGIYQDIPADLMKAAQRNVIAHLIDLHAKQLVRTDSLYDPAACFAITGEADA
jgi:hydroxyacylglutathione hydrolase